jgi:integrase
MDQLNLFQPARAGPHSVAFEAWLQSQLMAGRIRRASSAELYRDMWGSFAAWCAAQTPAVELDSLRQEDVLAFQSSRHGAKQAAMSVRHTLRLFRLIDQVIAHQAALEGKQGNPALREALSAQPEVRYAEAAANDTLPVVLAPLLAEQLMAFLSESTTGEDLTWQAQRDRVAVALQLGAGLGPAELRALKVHAPVLAAGDAPGRPTKLQVPGNGNSPARQTPMAPWAADLLARWLRVRGGQGLGGDWLFPSTRAGKPWGKVAQYNAAKRVLRDAGLQDLDGGSFRLRHTFALRQLQRGTSAEQVAQWLGVSDPDVMARYLKLLSQKSQKS